MARASSRGPRRSTAADVVSLDAYRAKRNFARTPEPAAQPAPAGGRRFVVQAHSATRMHYDLRLEVGGVLKSWAVAKGPSLDPKVRRLAVHVEDHPLDYAGFEGVIPEGQYGAGPVIVWDRGTYVPMGDPERDLARGEFKFRLDGEKLKGGFVLVRLKERGPKRKGADDRNWLLIKERDVFVRPEAEGIVTEERPESVVSGRTLQSFAQRRRRSAAAPAPAAPVAPVAVAPKALAGATAAPLPARPPAPQLATAVDDPPDGEAWLHEIKYDGYRTLARIAEGTGRGRVRLHTRAGHDWTERYAPVADALAALPCASAIIDGEIAVQQPDGRTSFSLLQDALARGASEQLVFFAFDLLYLDGFDLTGVPLTERKAALAALLARAADGVLHCSDHIRGNGPAFFAEAARLKLEGIVSKRADSRYRPGRSTSWLKTKAVATGEFVVVGYTESVAAGGLAALLLAEPRTEGLGYVGKVGTGFTAAVARDLVARLKPLARRTTALARKPREKLGKPVWVEPQLHAEVAFRGRTADDYLRAAVYRGLRAPEAGAASAAPARVDAHVGDEDLAQVWITNPQREMFGKDGPTKLDIALYYARVGNWMLPELRERPLTLVRCPSGRLDDVFYQKHATEGMPAEVRRVHLDDDPERAASLYVEDARGLLALAQFGVVEFHPRGCRIDKPDLPDRLVLDIDPDVALPWREVVGAAFLLRHELESLGLVPFVRTTGGKGLHVVAPVERRMNWSDFKAFAQAIVVELARREPHRFTASMSKAARRGRIYVDYVRNSRGATAVGSYSLRARAGAPAATPLDWDELAALDDPRAFDWRSVPERLAGLSADPWADIAGSARRITGQMKEKLRIHK